MTTTRMVSFQSGYQRLEAYLASPGGEGPFPGVVVIHEVSGLNDNIKEISQRFADEGYVALAVDLFANRNRAVCMARIMGGMLSGSPDRFGVPDLKAALGVLAEQPSVDTGRLGAIGFCMGGGFAIAWACTDGRLKARPSRLRGLLAPDARLLRRTHRLIWEMIRSNPHGREGPEDPGRTETPTDRDCL